MGKQYAESDKNKVQKPEIRGKVAAVKDACNLIARFFPFKVNIQDFLASRIFIRQEQNTNVRHVTNMLIFVFTMFLKVCIAHHIN